LKAAANDDAAVATLRQFNDAMLHVLRVRMTEGQILSDSSRLHDYLHARLAYAQTERLLGLFLDSAKRLICEEVISEGTVDRTCAYPREVLRRAIECGATALILVHNHPAGLLRPSEADRSITSRIAVLARALDIDLIDHLIVTPLGFFSFRREGLLP